MGESNGKPNAHCLNCAGVPEDSRGLWQVNIVGNPQFASWDLFDPATNARAALEIWQSQGWQAWGAFKAGTYEAFLQGGPVGAVQDALGSAVDAVVAQSRQSIVPWLIGGAAAVLVLLGRR